MLLGHFFLDLALADFWRNLPLSDKPARKLFNGLEPLAEFVGNKTHVSSPF